MQAIPGTVVVPSLLADDSGAQARGAHFDLLAELEGLKGPRQTPLASLVNRLRERQWLLAGVASACVSLALVLLVPGTPAVPGGRTDASLLPAIGPSAKAPVHPAVILDDPPPSRGMASPGRAADAGGTEDDPMRLLREDVAPVAARTARRAPPARADSDVDLLAALVHHAGRMRPGPEASGDRPLEPGQAPSPPQRITPQAARADPAAAVSEALAKCPAANTEAGLNCRQTACTGRWGEHPSCPRPTPTAPQPR